MPAKFVELEPPLWKVKAPQPLAVALEQAVGQGGAKRAGEVMSLL